MKTAISIPDPIFQAADSLARRLGISRSELYVKAIAEFMEAHKNQNITEILNKIYEEDSSELDEELNTMQLHSISKEEW